MDGLHNATVAGKKRRTGVGVQEEKDDLCRCSEKKKKKSLLEFTGAEFAISLILLGEKFKTSLVSQFPLSSTWQP